MERGKLIIEYRPNRNDIAVDLELVNDTVWLTKHEIAYAFNVFTSAVRSNLSAIFKNKELFEDEVTLQHKDVTYYNLDVVIALAFQCKSPICRMFRQWLRDQAKRPLTKEPTTILHCFYSPSMVHGCKDN